MDSLHEHVETSLRDVLKYNVYYEVNTGNPVIDMFLRIFILSIISALIGKILYFATDFSIFSMKRIPIFHRIYVWWKRPHRITVTGARYLEFRYMNVRFDFSMRFSALVDLIVRSLEERKKNMKLIRQLKEFQIRENVEWFGNTRSATQETQFIVDQPMYFELSDDIYGTIESYKSSSDHSSDEKKVSNVTREEYTIELWSVKYSCSHLLKFIENVTNEYEREKKRQADKSRYIFRYDGRAKDSSDTDSIHWKVCEFTSKRTLDNVFFEEKEHVVTALKRFTEERELYERIGKPWQLGILLEGEPGCGKTSFITALANYFGRSIKDCQFNRMKTVQDLEECIYCVSYDNKNMSMDKVIMVAEDFDCMTDIAKSRKLIERESQERMRRVEARRRNIDDHISSIQSDDAKAILCAIQEGSDGSVIEAMSAPLPSTDVNRITLSSLLNMLDGIHSLTGRIIVFSTNHPETLDEAFLRPGRIDLRIRFGRPSKKIIFDMMSHWYKCMDELYSPHNRHAVFMDKWYAYEEGIVEKKYRPCDIMNLMQIHSDDFDVIFRALCTQDEE